MAITKERKDELIARYSEWIKHSEAQIVLSYAGLSMKDVDTLRGKLRENGTEFHVVKNTLVALALEQAGMPVPAGLFEGSTAMGFATKDAPIVTKALLDAIKGSEFLKIKGGYLDKKPMTPEGVKALADLPPLPVMRARLLGMISTPASRIVRTLAEPARGLAAVIKAHAEPAVEAAAEAVAS